MDYVTESLRTNKSNSSIGRISLLLSPSATKPLINVEKISNRLITANVNGNPIMTVGIYSVIFRIYNNVYITTMY